MKKFIEQIYRNKKNYKGIVFLDRDGTINDEQIEILPTVVEGVRLLNKKRVAAVIITNQPVIARGLITIKELKKINDTLFESLKKNNAFVDAIYSCPHHPERNHKDIPPHAIKFRVKCECRKPGLAMYKKAISLFGTENILGVIGDQTRDIMAAKKLGVAGILVKTGHGGNDKTFDVNPDFVADNFLDAVHKLF